MISFIREADEKWTCYCLVLVRFVFNPLTLLTLFSLKSNPCFHGPDLRRDRQEVEFVY